MGTGDSSGRLPPSEVCANCKSKSLSSFDGILLNCECVNCAIASNRSLIIPKFFGSGFSWLELVRL